MATPKHRRLPRLDLPRETYFITSCCLDRKPWFVSPDLAELLWQIILDRRKHNVRLHAAVVMPDHYHLLLRLGGTRRIARVTQVIHSLSARRLNERLGRSGPIWQPRFYDHVVRNEEDLLEKLHYMHDNPLRDGLVAAAEDYLYSSARFWLLDDTSRGRFDPWD